MNDPSTLGGEDVSRSEFGVTPGTVDIWTMPIRANRQIVEELKPVLASEEWERALRFRADEHRDLFVVGRAILRMLLSCYVPERPEGLVFRYGPKGKPYLEGHSELEFNLAHSGDRAVYAVSGDELGVDIELIKPSAEWQNISRRFFSPREAEELALLQPAQQAAGFFACWTRKEAYIKATGEGLGAPLDGFYAGAQPWRTEGPIDEDGKPSEWYFKDLEVGNAYAGAMVTRFSQCRTRLFEFSRTEDCVRFAQERIR